MMTTATFVSELIRAANDVERLTMFERRRLLERVEGTIRDCRSQIQWTDQRVEYPASDLELELRAMAGAIAGIPGSEVAAVLLRAAGAIELLGAVADALRDGYGVVDERTPGVRETDMERLKRQAAEGSVEGDALAHKFRTLVRGKLASFEGDKPTPKK